MERTRQVTAAVVGIVIIVALVLLARWTGDKIRQRFLTPKKPALITRPVTTPVYTPQVQPTATYSAIPSTGPNDWAYVAVGTMAILGFGFLKLAARYL